MCEREVSKGLAARSCGQNCACEHEKAKASNEGIPAKEVYFPANEIKLMKYWELYGSRNN